MESVCGGNLTVGSNPTLSASAPPPGRASSRVAPPAGAGPDADRHELLSVGYPAAAHSDFPPSYARTFVYPMAASSRAAFPEACHVGPLQ